MFLFAFGKALQTHLIRTLALGGPDSAARCSAYLSEEPDVAARRLHLAGKKASLERARMELMRMARGGYEERMDGGIRGKSTSGAASGGEEDAVEVHNHCDGCRLYFWASESVRVNFATASSRHSRTLHLTASSKSGGSKERKSSPIRAKEMEQWVSWVRRDVRYVVSSTFGKCDARTSRRVETML